MVKLTKKGKFGQLKKYVIPTECLPGEPFGANLNQNIESDFVNEVIIDNPP